MKKYLYSYIAVGMLLLTSCTEDTDAIVPGEGKIAYVNFYHAAEAFRSGAPADLLGEDNMVFINDSVPQAPFLRFPKFSNVIADDGRQYPRHFTGSDLIIDNEAGGSGDGTYRKVYWMPIQGGEYNFIYTSRNKVFLKDTLATLTPQTYTTQYLAESPATDSSYNIVSVPVERQGTEGKVTLQFVHLSPDLGDVEIYRTDAEGATIPSSLPTSLQRTESSVTSVDIEGAAATNGRILVKIRRQGENSAVQAVAVPAVSGAVFTIVIQGFTTQTQRRLKVEGNDYITVTVTPNLRCNLRRMFF